MSSVLGSLSYLLQDPSLWKRAGDILCCHCGEVSVVRDQSLSTMRLILEEEHPPPPQSNLR